eukprot:scaffold10378_cov111-Isochrysis_galbana.AAC.2
MARTAPEALHARTGRAAQGRSDCPRCRDQPGPPCECRRASACIMGPSARHHTAEWARGWGEGWRRAEAPLQRLTLPLIRSCTPRTARPAAARGRLARRQARAHARPRALPLAPPWRRRSACRSVGPRGSARRSSRRSRNRRRRAPARCSAELGRRPRQNSRLRPAGPASAAATRPWPRPATQT